MSDRTSSGMSAAERDRFEKWRKNYNPADRVLNAIMTVKGIGWITAFRLEPVVRELLAEERARVLEAKHV